jgi:hypothetical protein
VFVGFTGLVAVSASSGFRVVASACLEGCGSTLLVVTGTSGESDEGLGLAVCPLRIRGLR